MAAAKDAALDRLRKQIEAGKIKLAFSANVYGSKSVRDGLEQSHKGKCAYCETKILPVATANVEHFRPKGAYINENSGALCRPGYYFLAYSWNNLLLSCPRCNSATFKGNRFPLDDETARAVNLPHAIGAEDPMFVDPSAEEPRDYIRFRGAVAYPTDDNVRGDVTIRTIGINREDLVDARSDHLRLFRNLLESAIALPEGALRNETIALLAEFKSVYAPFLSCAADSFEFDIP